jgi:hypothetical protein
MMRARRAARVVARRILRSAFPFRFSTATVDGSQGLIVAPGAS